MAQTRPPGWASGDTQQNQNGTGLPLQNGRPMVTHSYVGSDGIVTTVTEPVSINPQGQVVEAGLPLANNSPVTTGGQVVSSWGATYPPVSSTSPNPPTPNQVASIQQGQSQAVSGGNGDTMLWLFLFAVIAGIVLVLCVVM